MSTTRMGVYPDRSVAYLFRDSYERGFVGFRLSRILDMVIFVLSILWFGILFIGTVTVVFPWIKWVEKWVLERRGKRESQRPVAAEVLAILLKLACGFVAAICYFMLSFLPMIVGGEDYLSLLEQVGSFTMMVGLLGAVGFVSGTIYVIVRAYED